MDPTAPPSQSPSPQGGPKGRLKIFFGSAPGVGKTRTMLQEAQDLLDQRLDVVLGFVDTHDQPDVNALLAGLERLPPKVYPVRGEMVEELDVDAALRRRPEVLLVDDLAHANPPGARNRKRWQDVLDILDAGIHVYTSMSIQHLESLNDVVARITGLRVTETIPDTLLDRADEVELVDIPPEVLLERLEDGRVHIPESARHAVDRFFRKGNLMALREMALRFTAQRVDADMQRYMDKDAIHAASVAGDRILVAVDPSPLSARLIRSTCRLAAALKAPWMVVYAEPTGSLRYSERNREQVEEHLRLAEHLGAETVILPRTSSRVSDDILSLARNRGVTRIVVGKPVKPRILDILLGSTTDEIIRWSGGIDVYVITGESQAESAQTLRYVKGPTPLRDHVWATGAVALATGICLLLFRTPEHLASAVMIYLLAILLVGTRCGRFPSLLASTLSALALAYFFIKPAFNFHLGQGLGAMSTLAVLMGVGFAMGNLTERNRRHARLGQEREQRILTLFHLSGELAGESDAARIAELAAAHLDAQFHTDSALVLAEPDGTLSVLATGAPRAQAGQELDTVRWVFEHQVPAGYGTDHFGDSLGRYFPLKGTTRLCGVLGLFAPEGRELVLDQERLLLLDQSLHQIASALERVRLVEQQTRSQLRMDQEQLRAALLDSVSEDLAGPLEAIARQASALREGDCGTEEAHRRLAAIHREAESLHHLVRNLLDLARLESGIRVAERTRTGLGAVVLAAMDRLRAELEGRDVRMLVPDYLPAIQADPALLEQALVNLLDNAARYSPPGSPIEIKAWSAGNSLAFAVSDEGPGIQPGEEAHLFKHRPADPGTSPLRGGLGLAVVKAVVQAHEGSIQVHNRPTGGAQFMITLPMGEAASRADSGDIA